MFIPCFIFKNTKLYDFLLCGATTKSKNWVKLRKILFSEDIGELHKNVLISGILLYLCCANLLGKCWELIIPHLLQRHAFKGAFISNDTNF